MHIRPLSVASNNWYIDRSFELLEENHNLLRQEMADMTCNLSKINKETDDMLGQMKILTNNVRANRDHLLASVMGVEEKIEKTAVNIPNIEVSLGRLIILPIKCDVIRNRKSLC